MGTVDDWTVVTMLPEELGNEMVQVRLRVRFPELLPRLAIIQEVTWDEYERCTYIKNVFLTSGSSCFVVSGNRDLIRKVCLVSVYMV